MTEYEEYEEKIRYRKEKSKEIMDQKIPYVSLEMAVWLADYQRENGPYMPSNEHLNYIQEKVKENKRDVQFGKISAPTKRKPLMGWNHLKRILGEEKYDEICKNDERLGDFFVEYAANVAWDSMTPEQMAENEYNRSYYTQSFHGDRDRYARSVVRNHYKNIYPDFDYYDEDYKYAILDDILASMP